MVKYKITFDLDIEDSLEYDSDEQYAEIVEVNDECFDETFDTEDKINEFQDWFNDGMLENEKISIINIEYDRDGEGTCILDVTTESEIQDTNAFAEEIISYLFEGDYPTVDYHVTGTSYEDYWDYARSSPEQRTIRVDYDDSVSIHSYSNVNITKE